MAIDSGVAADSGAGIAAAIEVAGLCKSFGGPRGRRPALDGLTLNVAAGGRVHGFLGPNGCGKTTTLRILLGLVGADSGTVRLLGRPVPDALPDVVGEVGSLVESPQFFRTFSGRRNLALLAEAGGVPSGRVDELLETVGLRDRAGELVRGYSLGMRQRLAIAAAMLKHPKLLLLDEPSNGLDPAGIRDTRALIRHLADSGVTVVLSSHLLIEVQQVCDEVTIVDRGRTLVSGRVADVLAAVTGEALRVRLAIDDAGAAGRVLSNAGYGVERDGTHLVVTGAPGAAEVNRLLAGQGLFVSELAADTVDLEGAFLAITGGSGSFGVPEQQPGQAGQSEVTR